MLERFPSLEPAWVYAGIAYYLAHRQQLDDELDEEAREHASALAAQNAAKRH
jgi:hypothetical protein